MLVEACLAGWKHGQFTLNPQSQSRIWFLQTRDSTYGACSRTRAFDDAVKPARRDDEHALTVSRWLRVEEEETGHGERYVGQWDPDRSARQVSRVLDAVGSPDLATHGDAWI